MADNIRDHNVGASDYAKHKYQSWDYWIKFRLNPWDADLCKRILRTKATDGRKLDYEKIKHICGERIRQLTTGENKKLLPKYYSKNKFYALVNMMVNDYNLGRLDYLILTQILMRPLFCSKKKRISEYEYIQSLCDDCIKKAE